MNEPSFHTESTPAAIMQRTIEVLTENLSPDREPKATMVGLVKDTDRGEAVVNQLKWKVLKDTSLFTNAVNRIAQSLVRQAYDDANTYTTPQRYVIIVWAGQSQEDVVYRHTFSVVPGQRAPMAGLVSTELETRVTFEQQLAAESMRLMVAEAGEMNRATMAMYKNEIESLRATVAKRDETIEKLYLTIAHLQEKSGVNQERLSNTIVSTQERTVGIIDKHIVAIEQHRDGAIERELRIKREQERGGLETKAWNYLMQVLPDMAKHVLGTGGTVPTSSPSAVVGWLKGLSTDQRNGIDALVATLPEDQQRAYYAALEADIASNGVH